MARKKEKLLDIPVSWGNVSIGDKTARIGATVDRGHLDVSEADSSLCGCRVTGKLIATPNEDGQDHLPGVETDTQVEGVFDVKAISVSRKAVSFGLTFALGKLDLSSLAHFAKRNGRLVVESTEEIPDGEEDDADE